MTIAAPAIRITAPTTNAGAQRSTERRRGTPPTAVAAIGRPHSPQKRASDSSLAPHCVQNRELMAGGTD